MDYYIEQKFCWYVCDGAKHLVLMYFLNTVPFTFDDLDEEYWNDPQVIKIADQELTFGPEDLYRGSCYLIQEECHPCFNELDLVNPECMPDCN